MVASGTAKQGLEFCARVLFPDRAKYNLVSIIKYLTSGYYEINNTMYLKILEHFVSLIKAMSVYKRPVSKIVIIALPYFYSSNTKTVHIHISNRCEPEILCAQIEPHL